MSKQTPESSQSQSEAPKAPDPTETAPDAQKAGNVPDTTSQGQAQQTEPDTFPAAYVRELRKEAAGHRDRAKRADTLAQRLVTAFAAQSGKLVDPSDLPYSDDVLDADGLPDPQKVSAAVDALLVQKPHLARIKVTGDVGQGSRLDPSAVNLADMMRAGAA